MRTKEKEKINHLYLRTNGFSKATKNVAEAYPYYRKLVNELLGKSKKLYQLYMNENSGTKVSTFLRNSTKDKTIKTVLKLKRAVILHAIETGNKSLQRASNYTFSDFNRPSEEVRIARFHQILNAAKRIKHPEHFGLSRKAITDAEELFQKYCKEDSSAKRKKERAQQAKQCRKILSEINFILKNKMAPFLENIKDEYPEVVFPFKEFLKPVKMGRPANKPERKRKARAKEESLQQADILVPDKLCVEASNA